MRPHALSCLVMHVSTRCDQTCVHCSIWRMKAAPSGQWGVAQRLGLIREAAALGATAILFTGGEPLLCDHLEELSSTAKKLGLAVQVATNGLGLSRAASWLGEVVDEVYVSLEGPEAIHETVRGPRMFARLSTSLRDILALKPRPRLIARSAISSLNASALVQTVAAARSIGFDAISFLPIDVSSEAFGGDPSSRGSLKPAARDVIALREAIQALAEAGELGRYVVEDEEKLQTMADDLSDLEERRAPRCNAPEWSVVVEADGALRPCFFQPVVKSAPGLGLEATRRSAEYARAISHLGPGDRICASCVCPKYVELDSRSLRGRGSPGGRSARGTPCRRIERAPPPCRCPRA